MYRRVKTQTMEYLPDGGRLRPTVDALGKIGLTKALHKRYMGTS